MSLIENGTTIPTDKPFKVRGVDVDRVIANGVEVWKLNTYTPPAGHWEERVYDSGNYVNISDVTNSIFTKAEYVNMVVKKGTIIEGVEFQGVGGERFITGKHETIHDFTDSSTGEHIKTYRIKIWKP